MTEVRVSRVEDFAALELRWRDLERRADGSFFQSWTWVGCLAAERFPDPVLVEATDGGRTVALGLFNRVRRRIGPSALFLGETGNPEMDCPYVEQNGILTEAGRESELTALCLQPLAASHDITLSGIGETVLDATRRASGRLVISRRQDSPFVDLVALRRSGADYLTERSANTRQQLRRSDRLYQRNGPILLERAETTETAHAMLAALADLHQSLWQARGKPGSFARPFFRHFHRALIDRGAARGEVALMKISSDGIDIGFLYNFVWRRRMAAYQSGFVYGETDPHAKPGLTCHHAAIRYALRQGLDVYDFLAGDDRYKRSLGGLSHSQFWAAAGPSWSPRLLFHTGVRMFR